MKIKKAELKEFETAFAFCQSLWENINYEKNCMKEVYKRILNDQNSFMLFLLKDDSYVGLVHGTFFDTFWMSGKTCYLASLIVKDTERKKGYGKIMVDYVKKIAMDKECKAIILDSAFYRAGAHSFYEHYGFEKCCYGFEYLL